MEPSTIHRNVTGPHKAPAIAPKIGPRPAIFRNCIRKIFHHGNISVKSKVKKGTLFTIHLPCDKHQYTPGEMGVHHKVNLSQLVPSSPPAPAEETLSNTSYNLPSILIVEDNVALNQYLQSIFQKNYKVFSSYDAEAALKIARKKNLDLIVSDVMMPKMDGYHLCEAIKNNEPTSHIPLVLLTANSTDENQVTGMRSGADAYITKPFKATFLKASVNSIIENRKKLRKKQGLDKVEKEGNELSTKDFEFIEHFKTFINEHIENSALGVDDVAEHLNCSKSSLFRKVKALTGNTPNNFIKIYKINFAHNLILKEGSNVNEAAYKAGFSDPNYFTTCFKKQFGFNPSQVHSVVRGIGRKLSGSRTAACLTV